MDQLLLPKSEAPVIHQCRAKNCIIYHQRSGTKVENALQNHVLLFIINVTTDIYIKFIEIITFVFWIFS